MRLLERLWPALVVALAAGAGVSTLAPGMEALRPLLTGLFLLIGPGLPFIQGLRIGGWVARATLTVALSMALDMGVAQLLFYTGRWSPELALGALLALSLAATAVVAGLGIMRSAIGAIRAPRGSLSRRETRPSRPSSPAGG